MCVSHRERFRVPSPATTPGVPTPFAPLDRWRKAYKACKLGEVPDDLARKWTLESIPNWWLHDMKCDRKCRSRPQFHNFPKVCVKQFDRKIASVVLGLDIISWSRER